MKKDLPLVVLKAIEPFVKINDPLFERVASAHLIDIRDKDPESKFHFTIYKYQVRPKFAFLITTSPLRESVTVGAQEWVPPGDLLPRFEAWKKLIHDYETVPSVFDDPIIKAYADE